MSWSENRNPHVVGSWGVPGRGPTLVVIGGVHGNEPGGVVALTRLLGELKRSDRKPRGQLIGLRGNCQALGSGVRWVVRDLNRLWTTEQVDWVRSQPDPEQLEGESREQLRLLQIIEPLVSTAGGDRCYLLDLHTTSSPSAPFSIVDNQPSGQSLGALFPVTMVFGLQDEIDGTLVSHFDSRGIPGLGFEGGRHGSKEAVRCHLAILRLAIVFTGILSEEDCPRFEQSMQMLEHSCRDLPSAHQVRYRHPVQPGDEFRMEPGLTNFQSIQENQLLAHDRTGEILSPRPGRIFMPLYQAQGDDGFFIVDPIEKPQPPPPRKPQRQERQ